MKIDPKTGKRRFMSQPANRVVGKVPELPAPEQRMKGDKFPPELRMRARAIFVYERRSILDAAQECGVSHVTVRRWKTQCAKAGDDWDAARHLSGMSSLGRAALLDQLLEDFVRQYRGTLTWLENAGAELPALDRAHAMSRLACALEKVADAHGRLQPQQNRLAIAMDVIQDFVRFVLARDPNLAAALQPWLEPFGDYIAQHYVERAK